MIRFNLTIAFKYLILDTKENSYWIEILEIN